MAFAARPAPSEARVPCPLCGGLVHPIAGKCKHCKADLTSYHAARPPATAPLPSLQPSARSGPINGASHGNGAQAIVSGTINGHASVAAAGSVGPAGPVGPVGPVGMMVAAAREAAQPVLPQRPAAAYPAPPRPSSWRSWPIVVIVIAVLAILAAVALMLWPELRPPAEGRRTLQPPPAPERMQTEPELRHPAIRPPSRATKPAQDPPAGPAAPAAPAPRDPAAAVPDSDDSDPDPGAPDGSSAVLSPRVNAGVAEAVLVHICQKLDRCGADDAASRHTCDGIAATQDAPPLSCPAAIRCVARIDALPCGAQLRSDLDDLLHRSRECATAARC